MKRFLKFCRRLAKRYRQARWAWWLWRPRRLTFEVLMKRVYGGPNEPWSQVLKRDPCSYCGTYGDPTIEHVRPVGKRRYANHGPVENKVAACRPCNGHRGAMPLLRFLLLRQQAPLSAHERKRRATRPAPTKMRPSRVLRASIGEQLQWKSIKVVAPPGAP